MAFFFFLALKESHYFNNCVQKIIKGCFNYLGEVYTPKSMLYKCC